MILLPYVEKRGSWPLLCFRVDFAVFNNEETKCLNKVGLDCEQPSLVKVVLTHGKGFEIDDLQGSFHLKFNLLILHTQELC